MVPRIPTYEVRQRRRTIWHGWTLLAWGLMVAVFGKDQLAQSSYRYFPLPYWAMGVIASVLGLIVVRSAFHRKAMEQAIPGRILATFWTAIAVYLLLGNFRIIHIPLYIMLAYNAYMFLIRE